MWSGLVFAWGLVAPTQSFSLATAVTPYGPATILGCHDGDTCTISIPSLPSLFGEKLPMRLVGIDTPEINGSCEVERQLAIKAKQFLLTRLQSGGRVEIQPVARDKYFRILALISVDGQDLADELVAAGLAVSYNGGTKPSWCVSENQPTPPSVQAVP